MWRSNGPIARSAVSKNFKALVTAIAVAVRFTSNALNASGFVKPCPASHYSVSASRLLIHVFSLCMYSTSSSYCCK